MRDLQPLVYSGAPTFAACATAVSLVASATDVFTVTGSATKTVYIYKILLTGIATAAASQTVNIVMRSTANSSGTPATLTAVPFDSNYAAATATALSYTANPTTGTAVGNVVSLYLPLTTATSVVDPFVIDLTNNPVVLRGITQVLAVNLAGATVTGGAMSCQFVWAEL